MVEYERDRGWVEFEPRQPTKVDINKTKGFKLSNWLEGTS